MKVIENIHEFNVVDERNRTSVLNKTTKVICFKKEIKLIKTSSTQVKSVKLVVGYFVIELNV